MMIVRHSHTVGKTDFRVIMRSVTVFCLAFKKLDFDILMATIVYSDVP